MNLIASNNLLFVYFFWILTQLILLQINLNNKLLLCYLKWQDTNE